MKKTFILALMAVLGLAVNAQTYYGAVASSVPDEDGVGELWFELVNEGIDFTACQMEINLPAGVRFYYEEEDGETYYEDPVFSPDRTKRTNHMFDKVDVTDEGHKMFIIAHSTSNTNFKNLANKDSRLIKFSYMTDANLRPGAYRGSVSGIVFSYRDPETKQTTRYEFPDVEFSIIVENTLTATGDYQTLSLSYDAVVPNGVSVYTAELEGTWVVLTKQESDVLPKNTGVVVKADEGEYLFEAAEEGEYALTGSNILLPTGDEGMAMGNDVEYAYVLAKVSGAAARFYRYKDFLPANKAYFGWTSSASAPAYINIKRDEATGINAASEDGKAEYYDLSGRRAGSASRSLLIQKTENGNRVMIKK